MLTRPTPHTIHFGIEQKYSPAQRAKARLTHVTEELAQLYPKIANHQERFATHQANEKREKEQKPSFIERLFSIGGHPNDTRIARQYHEQRLRKLEAQRNTLEILEEKERRHL